MHFEDLCEFNTILTADCAEWRPNNDLNENILACGTYFLNKDETKRLGKLYLINFNAPNDLKVLQTIDYPTSGILDMKWYGQNTIITIDSNEFLEFFNINELSHAKQISKISLSNEGESSIGLTFDYTSSKIVTSNSKGQIRVLDKLTNNEYKVISTIDAHYIKCGNAPSEVWSVLVDKLDENLIFSGGDDCTLKLWDLRDQSRAISQFKFFAGGVTSIVQPDLSKEYEILCGSYDEKIYIIDKRHNKSPLKTSKKLNGGVWKMKVNLSKRLILAACMHTGVHIVNLDTLESCLYYDKHGIDNLAYGCDWKQVDDNKFLVATCSFYNSQLRLWNLNL